MVRKRAPKSTLIYAVYQCVLQSGEYTNMMRMVTENWWIPQIRVLEMRKYDRNGSRVAGMERTGEKS